MKFTRYVIHKTIKALICVRAYCLDFTELLYQKRRGRLALNAVNIRDEMRRLRRKYYEDSEFWDYSNRNGVHFMSPYMEVAVGAIRKLVPLDALIIDIGGGCGNLGLALTKIGFKNYTLTDIDVNRLHWGNQLWKAFGLKLMTHKEDVLNLSFKNSSVDCITLLGWEAPSLPYANAISECARVLKSDGYIFVTYMNISEIREIWDKEPGRKLPYSVYSINHNDIERIFLENNLTVVDQLHGSPEPQVFEWFGDGIPRRFPKYVLVGRKNRKCGSL